METANFFLIFYKHLQSVVCHEPYNCQHNFIIACGHISNQIINASAWPGMSNESNDIVVSTFLQSVDSIHDGKSFFLLGRKVKVNFPIVA